MKRRILIPLLLMLVLAVFVSACQPSVDEAKQQFCDSLTQLTAAAQKVTNLDANASVDDAKQAQAELQQAWQDFSKSADQLKDVQSDASEDAYNQVINQLQSSISGETTLGDSAQQISAGAKQLLSELKTINTTICGVK